MKYIAIFLCMVIGFACFDLQRVEIGEDDFKADQDARKAAYLDANETITEDLAIRSKDAPASVQSSDETSKEISEKPSSDAMSMSVASEVKKSGQRTHVGKPAIDLLSLLNYSHRNIAASSTTAGKMSFPRKSDARFSKRGPISLAIEIKWMFRRIEKEGNPKPVGRNSRLQSLKDFNTPWIMSQNVKVRIEMPGISQMGAKSIAYLFNNVPKQICRDAEILLMNVSSDCWKEVILPNFRNSHTADFRSDTGVAKLIEEKAKELDIFRPLLEDMIVGLYSDAEPMTQTEFKDGANKRSFEFGFQCPKEERFVRFENNSEMQARVFVICLCTFIRVFGIFVLQISAVYDLNDLNTNKNTRIEHVKSS